MKTSAAMLLIALPAVLCTAAAAPQDRAPMLAGERPVVSQQTPPLKVTYGLCSGPGNADAFPSNPVPVVNGECERSQEFKAESSNANYGGSCGGFTTAFGPMGDFKRNWKRRYLIARWVEAPLTQATCSSARIAAAGWGYRCDNEACTAGAWERIGQPTSKKGVWSVNSKVCHIDVTFSAPDKDYNTLNIDAIATFTQGGQTVRKRVGGTIRANRPNGQCPTATYTPSSADPPVQAASKIKIEQRFP